MGKIIAKTDISIRVPDGTYVRVAARSGLAAKNHIDIGAGVVDRDYRGDVRVVLVNNGTEPHRVSVGDPIAQVVPVCYSQGDLTVVNHLDDTVRGAGGFGSTALAVSVDPESRNKKLFVEFFSGSGVAGPRGNSPPDSPDGLVLFRRTFVESLVADSILHSDH